MSGGGGREVFCWLGEVGVGWSGVGKHFFYVICIHA